MDVKFFQIKSICFFCLAITDNVWCSKCDEDFNPKKKRCPSCGRVSLRGRICGACLKVTPIITKTVVLFDYQYPANQLIKSFKFNHRPELAHCLADKLANKLAGLFPMPEAIVAVPLHKTRQRERGYNQSLELCKQISKRLHLSILYSACERTINTNPQSGLPMKTRRRNLEGAFAVTAPRLPKHVVIVDDVITTGSTVNELARELIKAGCLRVDVWAIART
jgi:ComF family protein